jgi:hypothetical protein
MQPNAMRDEPGGVSDATRRERGAVGRGGLARQPLSPRERAAIAEVVGRVLDHVGAELVRVVLHGSRSRGEARPDSDLDLLLIFRALPPDREPHATKAEYIAERVARESGVPVTTWSVSLPDLACGVRTPMLVDSLEDGVVVWPPRAPKWCVRFTPADALHCTGALLERVREGSEEVIARLSAGDVRGAAQRVRGDVVRLCTALLLLRGETRPRRADVVWRVLALGAAGRDAEMLDVLGWAARSFGPEGRDEERGVPLPRAGLGAALRAVERLRERVRRARAALARSAGGTCAAPARRNPARHGGYR